MCRFCGKCFRKDSFLIRHVDRSHKGKKAFKCLKCNKEFDQRPHLVVHTRIHTGEKPFKCDFCDRTFAQNSSRIVHMRVHTGEKPYFCKNCGKSFSISNVSNKTHLIYCTGNQNKRKKKTFHNNGLSNIFFFKIMTIKMNPLFWDGSIQTLFLSQERVLIISTNLRLRKLLLPHILDLTRKTNVQTLKTVGLSTAGTKEESKQLMQGCRFWETSHRVTALQIFAQHPRWRLGRTRGQISRTQRREQF
uniref:C2H2-type domain-containing protein n=1 Tax=Labrus bergylta TaxID=56723 RepID=A0A3Q3EUT4_9LABR